MIFSKNIIEKMYIFHKYLIQYSYKLSVAESSTAGLLSYLMTYYSESSNFFKKGFIVYSNEAKIEILKIKHETLEEFKEVSEEVCSEMLINCQKLNNTDISLATTGYADYYNNIQNNGLIFLGVKFLNNPPIIINRKYNSGRNENRFQAIEDLINLIIENLPL
jgi:PncC family amidohydrolase